MTNNYGNGNQASGYPSNNNNWNNQNNPGWGNNNYNPNVGDGKAVASKCKKLAAAYLWLILLMIITAILAGVFAGLEISSSIDYSYNDYSYGYSNSSTSDATGYAAAYIAMIVIMVLSLISFEIIAIVLVVKTYALKNYYPENGVLWILYLVGLFIGITGIVSSFMTISACKKIERVSADGYYPSQNPSQVGPRY